MSKRKIRIAQYMLFMLIALVVMLSVVATYAYYSDRRDYSSSLTFGNIQIDANNQTGASSYFASSTLSNAGAGDYILNKDVSFNLKSGSEPAYIRAKYTASLNANKNLFNMGTASNYTAVLGNKNSLAVSGNTLTFTSDGGGSPGVLNNDIHEYTTGTAYTLSRSSGTRYLLRILDNNKQNITAGTISISGWEWNQWYKCYLADSSPATFSFSDASVKYFQIGFATNQNAGIVEQYTNVQLELGTTATSYVDCAPSEKNLFNINNVVSASNVVNNANGTLSVTPTSSSSAVTAFGTLKQYAPSLVVGKTYTLSAVTDVTDSKYHRIYLQKSTGVWVFGSSRTLTQNDLDSTVFWYANGTDTTFTATISNIQIEEGSTATSYEPYTSTHYEDQALANYFKYRNFDLGENIFSAEQFVSNAISLGYPTAKISVNNNYKNAMNVYQIGYAENYSKLILNAQANTTYRFSCKVDPTNLSDNVQTGFRIYYSDNTYVTVKITKSTTSLDFVTNSSKTLSAIGFSGWQYSGNFIAYDIKINPVYTWSEKIGDYYYLLDAKTGEPLEVSDSAKTYTFITKESSKIADNTFFGNVSGNSVKLTISIEAIQVANIDKLDQSKTILQNITTALNEIYNVETPSATYGVTFVIDKTSYSQSGIAYGGDATLANEVKTKINSDDFGGFAFYEGGYPVITKSSNGHSWLDLTNGKLKNITDNLTLYAVKKVSGGAQEYTVTFKNGSTTLQTGKASTENCYYFGAVPTKDATNTKTYEFAGWKKSGETTIYTDLSEVTISADTTFEAVFNEIARTFDIAFDLNEGYFLSSASVPTSYAYGTATTLPTAEMLSKPGYAFAGWFENADFSGPAVTNISATTVGNKTYYAKWTAN